MIAYPFTWKYEMGVELHQIREHLDKANRSRLEKDVNDASAWLERFLMISAFTIRRLSESSHAGIDLNKRLLKALSIRKRKGIPKSELSDLQRFSTNYQTDRPKAVTIPVRLICNQLIHSYIQDPADLTAYEHDEYALRTYVQVHKAVVKPATEQQVAAIIKLCA
jgi:hypothetical protein